MSFNIKTLIVCDTNSLRKVRNTSKDDGKLDKRIDYTSFSFGSRFQKIKEFIETNGLKDFVCLCVPTVVIDELKNQMRREYRKDFEKMSEVFSRMQELPHNTEKKLEILDDGFDYASFVETETEKFILTNDIVLIEYNEADAPSMLKNMLEKVIDQEDVKSPFRSKDAGLKDGIIWETLMHSKLVDDFNKVLFLTNDSDYRDNCKTDFIERRQRYIDIYKEENYVISELERTYGNYIKNRKIYEYASKDYFKDYLFDLMKNMTSVEYEGQSLTIENYQITEYCSSVNAAFLDSEGESVGIELNSKIVINTTSDGQKTTVPVLVKTRFIDIDYMEIEETTFEPNIN